MGDAANLQGRLIGQNVIEGNIAEYPGTIMTGICKIFDYQAGSTGLSEAMAKREGYTNIVTLVHSAPDKPGFMGANPIIIKLVANKYTGRLLGAQFAGLGDVSKRLAVAATAIQANMNVSDLICLDLPYAPPFSPAIDNFITAVHVLENKLYNRMEGISALEVKKMLDNKKDFLLLDVRGEDEYETMKLDCMEKLIPLGQLRKRLSELPDDKDHEIVAYCKISLRGYEAYSILKAAGWKNVKVLEGGLIAWPFDLIKC
jgi:rhodanese-related sulfurtransferase